MVLQVDAGSPETNETKRKAQAIHMARLGHWLKAAVSLLMIVFLIDGCGGVGSVVPRRQVPERPPIGSAAAQGTTYYVAPPPAGSDSYPGTEALPWATIQRAADTLASGDTVYIKAGTYAEQVIAQQSGSPGNYIVYAAYPGDTVIIDGSGITLPWYETGLFVLEDRSYIKVSGLRIVNAGPNDNNAGIYVDNAHHITVENNYTYNTTSSGIAVWNSSNVIVDGNEVRLACNDGEQEDITVANTDTFEVKNNHVHDGGPGTNGGEGITIKDGSRNGLVYGNHVHDIISGERTCLYVDAWDKPTYNIRVYQNVLHNCAAGISLASEMGGLLSDVRIYNNIIYDSLTNGLEIGNWGELGVSRRPIENVTFINNTAYNNGSTGWGAGFLNENPDVTGIVVRNNVFSQNATSQMVNESTASLTVDHNLIHGAQDYTYAISGTHYVERDPLFENPAAPDYHLQRGSPAIDSGSPVSAPGDDHEGNVRPQDGDGNGSAAYDIGAYEAIPALGLSSRTDPHPVEANTQVITYVVSLENSLAVGMTGVAITSTIPNSTTYSSGGDSYVDPNIVWSGLTAAADSSIEVAFQVSVTAPITDGDRLVNAISASSAQGITAAIPVNVVIVGLELVYMPITLRLR